MRLSPNYFSHTFLDIFDITDADADDDDTEYDLSDAASGPDMIVLQHDHRRQIVPMRRHAADE